MVPSSAELAICVCHKCSGHLVSNSGLVIIVVLFALIGVDECGK